MAEIKPFNGIMYNRDKVDIEKVVAPPYDVISPAMQNSFYQKDKYNIIRLILGKDGIAKRHFNKYKRAARFLNSWLRQGILARDKKSAIYVYTQDYLHKGEKKTRIGFIALMKIEDPKMSGILPHEYTLAKPKEDRLNLIKHTRANLSPVFSLFPDGENKISRSLKKCISEKNPLFVVEAEGVTHKLWRLENSPIIKKIKSHMRRKKIFIADGHHRYEVALTYRNMMRGTRNFKSGMDYVMMYFSNLSERENLTILSTHRVIKDIERFNEKEIRAKLRKYFYITPASDIAQCIERLERGPKKKHAFGMYTGNGKFYILTLKSYYSPDKLIDSKKNRSLKRLDVTILHDFIIDKILCLKNAERGIKYIRNENDAVSVVDKGDYDIAFFLRPTDVMEMKAVAEKGEMMPQKSTFFYPKLLSGLVINKF